MTASRQRDILGRSPIDVHVGEHVMFFGAALFYWWPMLSPSRALPPSTYAAQMVYFFSVLILMTPVFAYITFSEDILYPTYEYAPRLFPNFSASPSSRTSISLERRSNATKVSRPAAFHRKNCFFA